MQEQFRAAYEQLNPKQKQAVDTTEGPVLVVAGPGTGKTQLLGTRAAYIVQQGAVSASNILCLTFTDIAATEMRERLLRIMGPSGGDIQVSTFHSFGTWVINEYPEYFSVTRTRKPLDALGRYQIIESLLLGLPLRHPFAARDENEAFRKQKAVTNAIVAIKQSGLHATELRAIASANHAECQKLQGLLDEVFASNLAIKRLDDIEASTRDYLVGCAPAGLGTILLTTMLDAIDAARTLNKTGPLGDWRNTHTTIKGGKRVFKAEAKHAELVALIELYETYQKRLDESGRFDYEDMIIMAADALEANADIRLDLAERFQYIMVDEYQDTNGAQNRLLDTLLSANPLDSPNVLVVGDDDQAIMRFQGAEISGMLQFVETYKPEIIVLDENYRSGQPILDAARQIITQTDERLEQAKPELKLTKQLTAKTNVSDVTLTHHVYASPSTQYAAVAKQVSGLLSSGVAGKEIAVIGTRNAELKDFVSHLLANGIQVNYAKRASVLEQASISQLLDVSRYLAALADNPKRAEALLPQVLAAPYWGLGALDVYKIAAVARANKQSWLDTMLLDKSWAAIAEWLIAAATASKTRNFTQMFDVVIGRQSLPDTELTNSPYVSYLTRDGFESYATLLSHLICLRASVLAARPDATSLHDLLEVVGEYQRSGTELIDDNPLHRGGQDKVAVMTGHGAKGREFEHVFILSAVDTKWGMKTKSNNERIFMPENLPIYPAGDSESDKLRLLYVAMTRAKSQLTITSYEQTDAGKNSVPLAALQLQTEPTWWEGKVAATTPEQVQNILETAWQPLLAPSQKSVAEVLEPLLRDFRLSPSALKTFLDLRYGGPTAAIEQHILKFPSSYNRSSALGEAAHEALEAAQIAISAGKTFTAKQLLDVFDTKLATSGLSDEDILLVQSHGHEFLPKFFAQFEIDAITSSEKYVTAQLPQNGVPIGGKIDALKVSDGRLEVIDYKTGVPPPADWSIKGLSTNKQASQHFYRQQLLFYKLLLDNSNVYAKSGHVTAAELVFVEPNEAEEFIRLPITDFQDEELERTALLIAAVHHALVSGTIPDTSAYSKDLKGIRAFEDDLLAGK